MDSPAEMSAVDQAEYFEYPIRKRVLSTLF